MHDGTPLDTFTDFSTMGLCHLKILNCYLHLQHVWHFISDESNIKNNPIINPNLMYTHLLLVLLTGWVDSTSTTICLWSNFLPSDHPLVLWVYVYCTKKKETSVNFKHYWQQKTFMIFKQHKQSVTKLSVW